MCHSIISNDPQQNGIEYVILFCVDRWVRSFSKMLLYVKFAEDKVLHFYIIFLEKCENSATVNLTLILTLIS